VTPDEVDAGGVLALATTQFVVSFSEEMSTIDRIAAGNYELRSAGPNGIFDDGDDVLVPLSISVVSGSNSVRLTHPRLQGGEYRLTIRGNSLRDLSGNALDGDADGQAGGNYVRTFQVPRAGLTLSATQIQTSEDGDAAEFTVALSVQPVANVTVAVHVSDPSEAVSSPASLVFTPENWNVPQFVHVQGVDDDDLDGDVSYQVILTASSADPFYTGLAPATVDGVNLDNEVLNLPPAFEPVADVEVFEGQTIAITFVAIDPEGGTVAYSLAEGSPAGAQIDPTTGAFSWTPLDDLGPVAITIVAVDDGEPAATANLTFVVTVMNAPPTVELQGEAHAWVGEAYTLSLSAMDPSVVDQASGFEYLVDWDGDGVVDVQSAGGDSLELVHAFAEPGVYEIRAAAVDKDGGQSDWRTWSVTVQARPEIELRAAVSEESASLIVLEYFVHNLSPHPDFGYIVHIDWQDDGVFDLVAAGFSGTGVPRWVDSFGAQNIRARLIDPDDGQILAEATTSIWLAPYETQIDAATGLRNLVWRGTAGDDEYLFEELDPTTLRVTVVRENGVAVGQSLVIPEITGIVQVLLGSGDDRLDASGVLTKPLRIYGGDGNDTLIGGAADDFIDADGPEGRGNDWIDGGAGDDVIYADGPEGYDPDDAFGRDTIYGGEGDDVIYGDGAEGSDDDFIDGGPGNDVIYADGAEGLAEYGVYGSDTIYGGDGDDQIFADGAEEGGDDVIYGGEGDDLIDAGPGDDFVDGGGGNDLIVGGPGADSLRGGPGDDLILSDRIASIDRDGLRLLHAEWTRRDDESDYLTRVANLQGLGAPGAGLNGEVVLDSHTTARDRAVDVVLGEEGRDWLLIDLSMDLAPDAEADEIVTGLTAG
jgi:hypothetical protein